MSNIIKSAAYPTTKLIKKKIVKGTEVCVYRHPIMAGMEFLLSTGKVIGPAIRQVGYYDYTIVTSAIGETISEKSHTKVFFKR